MPLPTAPLPRRAIVIPLYNAEDWVERTILSVLDQAYPDLILIVVDDGSTDSSLARVRAFGDRVILRTGPNRGACHARNLGMAIARELNAEYILFLDADDYLEGEVLVGATETAVRGGADMVLSNMHILYPDGHREDRSAYSGQVAPETFFEGWMRGTFFAPVAILWRLGFVERIDGWDEGLSRAQDTDICMRAMFDAPRILKNDRGVAVYTRENPSSVSQNVSRSSTESRMKVTLGLMHRARGTSFERFRPMLAGRLYDITRKAFQMKQVDLGRQGLRELASLGYTRHMGTLAHRMVCNLIGLEAKVRLWGH
jgi:hypothetical protein